MTATPLHPETYLPDAEVGSLYDALTAPAAGADQPHLVTGTGEQVPVPPETLRALRQVIEAMHQGLAVTVVPQSKTLTTQQAADLLGVSRPTVIKVLEDGEMPFERAGNRRRILLHDVLAYRERRRTQQYAALEALATAEEDEPEVVLDQLRAARRAVAVRRRAAATS